MMGALLQGIIVAAALQAQATYTHDLASPARPLDPQPQMGKPSLATPGQPTIPAVTSEIPGTDPVLPALAK